METAFKGGFYEKIRSRQRAPPSHPLPRHKTGGGAAATQQGRYEEDSRRPRVRLPLKGGGPREGGIVNRSSTIETMSRIREIGFNERVNRRGRRRVRTRGDLYVCWRRNTFEGDWRVFDIVEGVSWRLLEIMEIRDRLYYDYMLFYIYIKRERDSYR